MTEEPYHIDEIGRGLTRIELSPFDGVCRGLSSPVNVYLVDGPSPALINAGHPAHFDSLARALRQCEVSTAEIERIIATSWRLDVVGAATQFPSADLFVLSPDMEAPRDLEMHIEHRRHQLLELAEEMAQIDDEFRRQPVEEAVKRFYPRTTRDLRFAPLRNGHFVVAGSLRLEVMGTAGPGPGHMALYDDERHLLFCGDFSLSGLPDSIEDPQAYLVSIERLAALPSETVCPNRGRVFSKGRWTVSRAGNFLNNFLSNAPAALVRSPTVMEFIERDRGASFDSPVEQLLTFERFQQLFDELVRSNTIAAEGQGLQKRYGVDVEDPREKLRRH